MRPKFVRLPGRLCLASGVAIALSTWISLPVVATAQGLPTPAQADVLARDPAMVARVRQQMEQSGMTPDQIRARLRALGYSESTLDAVMPGSRDSSGVLNNNVFAAVRALGIMDSATTAGMLLPRTPAVPTPSAAAVRAPEPDPSFRIFGRDVFTRYTTLFDPNLSGPVDPNYVLGNGDQMVLVLTGDVETSYAVSVNREGFINVPNLGTTVQVGGHTMREVQADLLKRLGKAYSGLKPDDNGTTHLLVTLAKKGIIQVRVEGDVTNPALIDVPNSSSIIAALYRAGGPTDEGSMRDVRLMRGSRLVGSLDLYTYFTTGVATSDLPVASGDVIFVPSRGPRVRITGAVVRPMTYEIKPGETLRDVVKLAGGFTPEAERRRVQIERIVPPTQRTEPGRDREVHDIMDPALATGFGPATALEPGDVIRVDSVAARLGRRVTVRGNVWSQGSVAFAPGLHLSDALRGAGGLKSDTYLGQVNIARLLPDSTRILIRTALRDTLGTPTDDVLLSESDDIEVFSVTTFRPNRYVGITGAVHHPGQFPYREGMTLRDLTLEAGGLLEGAMLTQAEIARMPVDRAHGTLATTMLVPLDSLYLFEREPGSKYLGPPGVPAPARSPDVVLQPYDNVLILRQPDWAYQQTVAVEGEVVLPGIYTLKSKDERIRDVILRAGGLKPSAYANGITLVRGQGAIGRIGIDLPAVLRDSTNIDNLLMVGGDSIFIPTYSGIISVRGEVYTSLSVAYTTGADLAYYLRAAGGTNLKADVGRTYVIQPNGKVESTHRGFFFHTVTPTPEPGSTIVVPPRDSEKRLDWGQVATATFSTLGSLVAIVAILRR